MYALDITTFGGRETILDVPVSDFFQWVVAAGESSEIVYALPSV
jgi:hypothetical protein